MKIRQFAVAMVLPMMVVACSGCPAPEADPWRSALYPEAWTPDFTDGEGRFLHDFSYAGYHNGEVELPSLDKAGTYNVVDTYGADNTGAADATAAIQAAIDAAEAASGGVVYLPTGLYRCDGMLTINQSGVVIRGDGPTLSQVYFTLASGMSNKAHITFAGNVRRGADIPLAEDGVNRAFGVRVNDASGLTVGDEVAVGWVITDEFIEEHNMTGTWQAFNGKWQPIFRRTVTAIDTGVTPHEVTFDLPLRYPAKTRDSASLRIETGYLEECGIEELGIATAVDWDAAWAEVRTHAVKLRAAKNCWVRDVASFASPLSEAKGYHLQNGGIKVENAKQITVADCRMEKAQNRGGGGCGYLYEISVGNEVLTRDCVGIKGRHNFIQNWGFGTTGCVWLRCKSSGSRNVLASYDPIGLPAYCEYHHSLATGCLVDQCEFADGWYGGNRNDWSTGAGLTCTQSVYWNTSGGGQIQSWQYGLGYIIGTDDITVKTALIGSSSTGSAPEDYVEGKNLGSGLQPQSLYEDQLQRRLGK